VRLEPDSISGHRNETCEAGGGSGCFAGGSARRDPGSGRNYEEVVTTAGDFDAMSRGLQPRRGLGAVDPPKLYPRGLRRRRPLVEHDDRQRVAVAVERRILGEHAFGAHRAVDGVEPTGDRVERDQRHRVCSATPE